MRYLHLRVVGKVQGVFFRKHTVEQAKKLGITRGTVRNLPDGRTVEIFAFSPDVDKLIEFKTWATTEGSPKSQIEDFTFTSGVLSAAQEFAGADEKRLLEEHFRYSPFAQIK